jgi:hypothetical protein
LFRLITYMDTYILIMTPLDKRPARLAEASTTHNIRKRRDIHAPTGFEPAIPASELPQAYSLDGETTENCSVIVRKAKICYLSTAVTCPC